MMYRALLLMAAIATLGLAVSADSAAAKCTKLAFSVNDYGKEGPSKDAQALLDKYIADWTAKRGIKKYTTGKKEVTCELFLDFGVFDEHTCKAAATVCWTEGGSGAVDATASPPPATDAPVKKVPAPTKAPTPVKKKTDTPA